MRIAFIGLKGLPTPWTGVEYHVERLGRGLAARGHEVTAYVRPFYTPPGLPSHAGIRLRRLPTIRSKHLDAAIHSFLASLDAAVRRFDIVHYHCIGPGFFSIFPRLASKRVVCTVHRLDWQADKWGRFARRCLRLGEMVVTRAANRIIVVSVELREYFRERYGLQTVFVPNGMDAGQKRPACEITRRWGLSGRDYVLFLGRLSPEKRVDWLIRAFQERRQVVCNGKLVKLVIAGGFNATEGHVRELKRLAAGNPGIVFTGFVEGLLKEELLSNAALFVLPSRIEGMPIVLLEARAFGLCCLASDIAPHRAILTDGVDGRLFDASSLEALATTMHELLEDDEARQRMAEAAYARAAGRPSWDAVVAATEGVYRGARERNDP